MEKRKTVEQFPAFPQPRLRLFTGELCAGKSRQRNAVVPYLACFGVKADKQLVGHGDANDFRRFAGCAQPLLEGDEVRFMTSDHTAHDEQNVAHCGAASTHSSSALVLA